METILAHHAQKNFCRSVLSAIPLPNGAKVLDIGSLDINGGAREWLPPSISYLGVDLELGPNVDIACPAQLLDLQSHEFELVVASELFEHTPFWREIFAQMCRMTKPGGMVIFTCATTGRLEHGTTRSDGGYAAPFVVNHHKYYGNVSLNQAQKAVATSHWFEKYGFYQEHTSKDLYFLGIIKNDDESPSYEDFFGQLSKTYPYQWWRIANLLANLGLERELEWLIMPLKANRFLYEIYLKIGAKKIRDYIRGFL